MPVNKMRKSNFIAVVAMSVFLTNSFAQEPVGGTTWKARMQSMLSEIMVLFPYAFDETKFNEPKNESNIATSLKSLAEHSAGLKKHTANVKRTDGIKIDPSFSFIADAFENEILSAQVSFSGSARHRHQAQIHIRSAISKCMACHTQSAIGPSLNLDHFKEFQSLNAGDRLMALAATRQFDQALLEFEKYLKDAKVTKPDVATVDRQARAALAIAVRVKKDPKRTMSLVDQIIASEAVSPMALKDAHDWRKSVIEWQSEKLQEPDTDKKVFAEAKRLAASKNSNVTQLRATAYLHDLLTKYPESKLRPETYILLASTYDQLPGYAIWDLSDEYLGACIKENPHSEIGEKCFSKYKESVVLGYTGSAGTNLPSAVSKHLQSLKELATRTVK